MPTARRSTAALAIAAVATLGPLAGCSAHDADSASSAVAGDAAAGGAGAPDIGVSSDDTATADAPQAARAYDTASGGGVADVSSAAEQPQTQASIISTGTIRSTSDDVTSARSAALDVIADLGGTVSDEDTRTDTDGTATRTHLVVRVPAASFTKAMERLERIGDLRASSTSAEDVTTQVVDTAVRVRVQRAGIRRITALLDRAGSLRDVIRIESELSRRQADLESLLQQQKYLKDQTSLSTITLEIGRTGTVPDDEDRSGFLGGLRSGWDAFTGTATGLATAAGAVLPFAVVAAAVGAIVVPLVRRRRRQSAIG